MANGAISSTAQDRAGYNQRTFSLYHFFPLSSLCGLLVYPGHPKCHTSLPCLSLGQFKKWDRGKHMETKIWPSCCRKADHRISWKRKPNAPEMWPPCLNRCPLLSQLCWLRMGSCLRKTHCLEGQRPELWKLAPKRKKGSSKVRGAVCPSPCLVIERTLPLLWKVRKMPAVWNSLTPSSVWRGVFLLTWIYDWFSDPGPRLRCPQIFWASVKSNWRTFK